MRDTHGENLPHIWDKVLALYEDTRVEITTADCRVRVAGRKPVLIPAHSLQVVKATVQPATRGQVYHALVQEHDATLAPLPTGLVLGPSLVTIDCQGHIPVQIANFTEHDLYLAPRTIVGTAYAAEDEPQIDVVHVSACEVQVRETDIEDHAGTSLLDKMDVGPNLEDSQTAKLGEVISKHKTAFSSSDHDIGRCDLVEHRIHTNDDMPIKVPHRRIPPHNWDEVREYLRKSLDMGIIRESCSPYSDVSEKEGRQPQIML
jgi:hypothetical protein